MKSHSFRTAYTSLNLHERRGAPGRTDCEHGFCQAAGAVFPRAAPPSPARESLAVRFVRKARGGQPGAGGGLVLVRAGAAGADRAYTAVAIPGRQRALN